MFRSTKTYGHEVGFSCAFRQWRANSHCKYLHGYALKIHLEFEAETLDERNWVVDFGGLKSLKAELEQTFDHMTVVAQDDPELSWFEEAHRRGILQLVVLPSTGCEKFAEYAYTLADTWLENNGYKPRCRLVKVEVHEHGANSATYLGNK